MRGRHFDQEKFEVKEKLQLRRNKKKYEAKRIKCTTEEIKKKRHDEKKGR